MQCTCVLEAACDNEHVRNLSPPSTISLQGCSPHLIRVFLDVLDGLQHTQSLVWVASKGQVVDGGVLDDTLQSIGYVAGF